MGYVKIPHTLKSRKENDIEKTREEFWKQAYLAYVGAANSTDENGAAKWADIALVEFDKRFKL
jgi:hypothetical protein